MPVLLASSPHYSTTAETPGRTVKVRKEKKKKKTTNCNTSGQKANY